MHSQLRHYTSRFQHSRRLRYRTARLLAIWLPLVLFLYALALLVATRGMKTFGPLDFGEARRVRSGRTAGSMPSPPP